MSSIVVDGLTKDYGSVLGIDSLSFTVEEGEVFGFLGPNGAGKTTTIRLLLGLISPTDGNATVLGADVTEQGALVDAKRRIGYLPAALGFHEDVTGKTILDYHASIKGATRLEHVSDRFDPPLDRPVREYSTGNKRMLGIIQAFMHDPDLVIMDEPTAGLDPVKQEEFNAFIGAERERGTTIFFSSHVLSEVRRVCDRVGILRDGMLVALEDIETLLKRGGKRVHLQLLSGDGAEIESLAGAYDVSSFPSGVRFTYSGDYTELVRTLADFEIAEIDISEPPLDDVFMHYYGSSGAGTEDAEVVADV